MLHGKTVVLGVTGGIAAYKAVEVVSRLKKLGADVHVIMTEHATRLIGETTFREMSQNPVVVDMFAPPQRFHVQHIALAKAADVFLVAPATANILAKASYGLADDMLSTTLLATKAPVFFAPAMNAAMWENPVTQENVSRLKQRGCRFIEPGEGWLACGDVGKGRMAEPEQIVEELIHFFQTREDLQGFTLLVTAGGTQEPIDPVRYIGNRSSGKMGYAVASRAAARGAGVILISAPTHLTPPAGVEFRPVKTALEMFDAVLAVYPQVDGVFKAAAVADYRVEHPAAQKIKKGGEQHLTLVRNPDILLELGRRKTRQILIGTAAETENVVAYAKEKLAQKNLDLIMANDVTIPGAGFESDTNKVFLIDREGRVEDVPMMSKEKLADLILDRLISLWKARKESGQ